ncbi:unnamed protein product [Closterium sp. NIES-64]|nr:unnamed protein product [Closterium sp. NIES-64]
MPLVAKPGSEAWEAKGAPDRSQGLEEQARQQRLWKQSERAAERRRKARASDFVLRKPYADIREEYVVARKEIGSGQFGIIRKCVQRQTGLTFACKSIAKAGILTAEDAEDVRNEVGFLEELRGHPHIVAVHATFEDDDNIHIVMELCKGGDLFDRIKLRGRMPEPAAAAICKALVGVLLHCHARGVLHMDVKPENVLMCDRSDDTHMKLIDFGVATRFTAGVVCREVLGTPEYIAPEVLKGAYGPPADLWSAGVVLYVMLAGAPPFWERASKTLKESILGDDVPFPHSKWGDRSAECKELIRRMLDKDPATRITGKEILDHIISVPTGEPRISKMGTGLTLYGHVHSPFVRRVLLTLYEMGVEDFEMKVVNTSKGDNKTPEFLAMNPFGKMPVLDDNGRYLNESRAIMRYIAEKYAEGRPNLVGADVWERAEVSQWTDVEAHSVTEQVAVVVEENFLKRLMGKGEPDKARADAAIEKLGRLFDIYEKHLEGRQYLVGGRCTLADLTHLPYTEILFHAGAGDLITSRPNVAQWWERISSRPAWKKVQQLEPIPA